MQILLTSIFSDFSEVPLSFKWFSLYCHSVTVSTQPLRVQDYRGFFMLKPGVGIEIFLSKIFHRSHCVSLLSSQAFQNTHKLAYLKYLFYSKIPYIFYLKRTPYKGTSLYFRFQQFSLRTFQWYITFLYRANIGMFYTLEKLMTSAFQIRAHLREVSVHCAFNGEFTVCQHSSLEWLTKNYHVALRSRPQYFFASMLICS